MSQVQTATTNVTSVSMELQSVRKHKTQTSLQQCLVVSPNSKRASLLGQAADGQGWKTIVATGAEEAASLAVRNRIQLTLVDLQSVEESDEGRFRDLVEQLAASSADDSLLIVCGKEEDLMGEVWSRQLGVWMYLPGIDDETDIGMLCGEARDVVEKLCGAKATTFQQPVPR